MHHELNRPRASSPSRVSAPVAAAEGSGRQVDDATYERIALADREGKWELVDGRLRNKPPMTYAHNQIGWDLGFRIQAQLSAAEFVVRVDAGRASGPGSTYFIPDVMVIPKSYTVRWRADPYRLEAYPEPLPLVVEVWSPSTGAYDVDTKLPVYQRRGDLEIWRIHPHARTLTAWQRQANGSYSETLYRGGHVRPIALPNVTIDLDVLFDV
ncbi:MAG: Uma2 family endonuclease [Dehalococcoidia bacterium]